MRTCKPFPSRDPRRLPDFFCLGAFGYHQHSDDTTLAGYSGKPHYPLPAIVPPRIDDATWGDLNAAARWFNSIGSSGGINWAWKYFLSMSDAEGFETWCKRNFYETRGIYPAWERGPISVRYR